MARRCGCASDSCSCMVVGGDGVTVTGAGSERNPFVVSSVFSEDDTGFDVQYNNTNVVTGVHRLDFRGTAVNVTSGPDEAVVTVTVPDPTTGVIIPTGTIWMFGMTNMPAGWLLCDGRTNLLIADYPNLFAALGTTFGGNGTTTFGVPLIVDRFVIGASAAHPIGSSGGSTSKAIQVANLPPHTHKIDHNHPAKNTNSAGTHQHDLYLSNQDGTGNTLRRGGPQTNDISPAPIVSAPGHVHVVDLYNYVGDTTGTTGANGADLDVTPPYLALPYGIKS